MSFFWQIFFAILGTSNSAYCLVCTHTSLDTPQKFLDDEISDMNSAHCLPVAFIPQVTVKTGNCRR